MGNNDLMCRERERRKLKRKPKKYTSYIDFTRSFLNQSLYKWQCLWWWKGWIIFLCAQIWWIYYDECVHYLSYLVLIAHTSYYLCYFHSNILTIKGLLWRRNVYDLSKHIKGCSLLTWHFSSSVRCGSYEIVSKHHDSHHI